MRRIEGVALGALLAGLALAGCVQPEPLGPPVCSDVRSAGSVGFTVTADRGRYDESDTVVVTARNGGSGSLWTSGQPLPLLVEHDDRGQVGDFSGLAMPQRLDPGGAVSRSLEPPEGGWPDGSYRVTAEAYLEQDGCPKASAVAFFEVR